MFTSISSGPTTRLAALLASAALTLTVGGPAAMAAPQAPAGTSGAAVVPVREGNFFIALPRHGFRAGTVHFSIKNVGRHRHALSVAGPGVHSTSAVMPPGGRTSLTVSLKKGRYLLWCPVDHHRQRGMWTWIRVR
ncbi:hypothetical protein [Nonomuraea roseoviolacea]|uniref:EfeO-type cupredoxin-like domain-containing protein n=1 Tax=Nonomuraea roseoviolacea subsp. carminata TaxID=160689 RepID=A0ABT1KGE0_9ACTN|nr:hypothetical protein [Nonomuraea roseoviolacea]MCP2352722.1 hypothetical protein [Nonomuraea roseoviolacea subsp. carminata]